MSYYFAIIGTKDNPLFEHAFGTSKPGGDGLAHFRDEAAHMNQFLVHAALDLVEEAQWATKDMYSSLPMSFASIPSALSPLLHLTSNDPRYQDVEADEEMQRYLKKVDTHQNNHIHAYLTGGNVKFMLLMNADPTQTPYAHYNAPGHQGGSRPSTARQSLLIAANPTSAQTEEAVRGFMGEVRCFLLVLGGEGWGMCLMC